MSVNFCDLERAQREGNWTLANQIMLQGAKKLVNAGADFIVICSNTGHHAAGVIEESIKVPLVHIGDAIIRFMRGRGFSNVGLLGTIYTSNSMFIFKGHSAKGLKIITPDIETISRINDIIYKELCLGIVLDGSRDFIRKTIELLFLRDAESVVLACTELQMIIDCSQERRLTFDSLKIHVEAVVDYALAPSFGRA